MPSIAIDGGRKFRVDRKTGRAVNEAAGRCAMETSRVHNACSARNIERRPGAMSYGFMDECDRAISEMAAACSRAGAIRGLAAPPRRRKQELVRLIRRPRPRAIRLPRIKEPLVFPRETHSEPRRVPYEQDYLPEFPTMDQDIYDDLYDMGEMP